MSDHAKLVRKESLKISSVLSYEPTPFQLEQAVNFLCTTIPRALDRLVAERDAWSDAHDAAQEQVIVNHRRAEAAEARVTELKAALLGLLESETVGPRARPRMESIARAALSPSATGGDRTDDFVRFCCEVTGGDSWGSLDKLTGSTAPKEDAPVGVVKDGILRWTDDLGIEHSGPFIAPKEDA